jgi:hypothetical protein
MLQQNVSCSYVELNAPHYRPQPEYYALLHCCYTSSAELRLIRFPQGFLAEIGRRFNFVLLFKGLGLSPSWVLAVECLPLLPRSRVLVFVVVYTL